MADGRRRANRQLALDIANCVGASFSDRRVEWEKFLSTGQIVVWDRYPLPMSAAIKAKMEELKAHEANHGG